MASSSHVPNISLNILLQALDTPGQNFGTVTHMVDEDEGLGNGLNGARFIDFADLTEVASALTSGYITAEVEDAMIVAFGQTPAPNKVRVCRVDTGAGSPETYSDALALLFAEAGVAGDVYGLTMDTRTTATQLALALTVEANKVNVLMLQSADADWLTAADPAAFVVATAYEHTGVTYHSAAGEYEDIATIVRALSFDPDVTSAPWEGPLALVGSYTTFLTATQRNNAIANNVAVLGTWGSSDSWIDNVVALSGRPLYERLTADWLGARISERLQTYHQRETTAGRKILVTPAGHSAVVSIIEGVLKLGEAIGHFVPGQTKTVPQGITAANVAAREVVTNVSAQIGTSIRNFTINGELVLTPVFQ